MKNLLVRFVRNESGATAIEYSLIAGLIAVGIIAATSAVGTDISGLFDRISTKLKAAV
ncbi:Flp family type IVb pilin [Ensifer sp. IC3342]|nr:Flp family type IVb pilin [Ensifer sp. BRP08]MCA1449449.1 Flp family type IVb pilin [Ensifer sp. IC3342]